MVDLRKQAFQVEVLPQRVLVASRVLQPPPPPKGGHELLQRVYAQYSSWL